MKEVFSYSPHKVMDIFSGLALTGDRSDWEYFQEAFRCRPEYNPCYFYHFLAVTVRVLKAKQVVEIGAHKGGSAIFLSSEMPEGKVYSIDNCTQGDTWDYVTDDYANKIIKIRADSTDINEIEKTGVDLHETDVWVIDGEHSPERIRAEVALFSKYWKKGAVIIFDDITLIQPAFSEIEIGSQVIIPNDLHVGGVGILVI